MTMTNFDRYLEKQLEDPEFTNQFEQAGQDWDVSLHLVQSATTSQPESRVRDALSDRKK